MNQTETDATCRRIYDDTRSFLQSINLNPPLGFKVLNGPPIRHAEILFVGYQPGGNQTDANEEIAKGTDKGWPDVCEYATAAWPLAPKMRRMFTVERLKKCVGTNVIFLRYPNAKAYVHDVKNNKIAIEQFCSAKVLDIVRAIDPKQIVTIGFEALTMFGPVTPLLTARRTLIKSGQVGDRSAVGILHPTGARPSVAEMTEIARWFQATC
jgi:hypothetical protein